MAKLHQERKGTSIEHGVGRQVETRITYDDSTIPSPTDLEKYNKIDPNIVKHFLETAKLEQISRHQLENKRLDTIAQVRRNDYKINILGIISSTIILLAIIAISLFALYWNRAWLSTLGFIVTIVSVAALLVRKGNRQIDDK